MIATEEEARAIRKLVTEVSALFENHNFLVIENALADLTAWWLVSFTAKTTEDLEQVRTEALKHFVNQVIDFAEYNEQLFHTEGSA